MMKFLLFFLLFALPLYGSEENHYVYVFDSFDDPTPEKMILVGEIKTKIKSASITHQESPVREFDTRKDIVTVKLQNSRGLKVGQRLYVVHKDPHHEKYRNAIKIGEITVRNIFFHPLYGEVLIGEGNLLRVRENSFVVRELDTEKIKDAYLLMKKGDNYFYQGETEEAMKFYTRALQLDPHLAGAHYRLGNLFYQEYKRNFQSIALQNALKEFELAWKLKDNFSYNTELYEFTKTYYAALLENFLDHYYFHYRKDREEILFLFNRMKDLARECQKLSEDEECLMAYATALFFEYKLYSGEETKEDREKKDVLRNELGQIFKSIEEEGRQKQYLRMQEFLDGNVRFLHTNFDTAMYEFAFINFYYEIYKELDAFRHWKEKQKLNRLLKLHMQRFFSLTEGKRQYKKFQQLLLPLKNEIDKN